MCTDDAAADYDSDGLSLPDRLRAQIHPTHAQSTAWKSSRALKQQISPDAATCLSHTHGAAAAAAWQSGRAGVDIEYMRPRKWAHWHDWIIHEDEAAWLHEQGQSMTAAYALWTLKESLIKAGAGQWADLPQVGIRRHRNAWVLRDMQGRLYSGKSICVENTWMLSCVWSFPAAVKWLGNRSYEDYVSFQAV